MIKKHEMEMVFKRVIFDSFFDANISFENQQHLKENRIKVGSICQNVEEFLKASNNFGGSLHFAIRLYSMLSQIDSKSAFLASIKDKDADDDINKNRYLVLWHCEDGNWYLADPTILVKTLTEVYIKRHKLYQNYKAVGEFKIPIEIESESCKVSWFNPTMFSLSDPRDEPIKIYKPFRMMLNKQFFSGYLNNPWITINPMITKKENKEVLEQFLNIFKDQIIRRI